MVLSLSVLAAGTLLTETNSPHDYTYRQGRSLEGVAPRGVCGTVMDLFWAPILVQQATITRTSNCFCIPDRVIYMGVSLIPPNHSDLWGNVRTSCYLIRN